MFSSLGNSANYVVGTDRDGDSYWQHQAERHRQHRRSVVRLAIAIGAILIAAVVVDPTIVWAAVVLVPIMAMEWWLARRSRPTSKIPDFRPPDPVDVPLDRD